MIYPGTRLDRYRNSFTTSAQLLANARRDRARALADPVFASETLWQMVARGQFDAADLSWGEDGTIHQAGVLLARRRYDPVIALYGRSMRIAVQNLQAFHRPLRLPMPRTARAVRSCSRARTRRSRRIHPAHGPPGRPERPSENDDVAPGARAG